MKKAESIRVAVVSHVGPYGEVGRLYEEIFDCNCARDNIKKWGEIKFETVCSTILF